jgi:hypothetical protein
VNPTALTKALMGMISAWVTHLHPQGVGAIEIIRAFQGFDAAPRQTTIRAALEALVHEPVLTVRVPKRPGRPKTTDDEADFANSLVSRGCGHWPAIVDEWLRLHPDDPMKKKRKTLGERIRGAWRRKYGDKARPTESGPK